MYDGSDVGLLVGGTLGDTEVMYQTKTLYTQRGRHGDSVGGSIIFVVASVINIVRLIMIGDLLFFAWLASIFNLTLYLLM